MKNQVAHKYKKGTETVRIGNVRTTFTWNGKQKKPIVTHSYDKHTIPEERSLNSLIATDTLDEDESTLKSHPQQDNLLFIGA